MVLNPQKFIDAYNISRATHQGLTGVLGGEGRGAAVDLPVHKQMELVVSSSGRNGGDTARGNLEQC